MVACEIHRSGKRAAIAATRIVHREENLTSLSIVLFFTYSHVVSDYATSVSFRVRQAVLHSLVEDTLRV